jgi:hypothetical protein
VHPAFFSQIPEYSRAHIWTRVRAHAISCACLPFSALCGTEILSLIDLLTSNRSNLSLIALEHPCAPTSKRTEGSQEGIEVCFDCFRVNNIITVEIIMIFFISVRICTVLICKLCVACFFLFDKLCRFRFQVSF